MAEELKVIETVEEINTEALEELSNGKGEEEE
jgi:hypothetical protein